jgi:hypothetical protein
VNVPRLIHELIYNKSVLSVLKKGFDLNITGIGDCSVSFSPVYDVTAMIRLS